MTVVTGGAGFIGSHLVKRLVEDGADVLVLDNLSRGNANAVHAGARLQCLDICDLPQVEKAMTGAETVFHLAGQANVVASNSNPRQSFDSNVIGTYNVLSAAANAGAKRFLFTSSREVYGEAETLPVPENALINPNSPYGASKVAGELYCHDFGQRGLEFVVLRLADVYGAGDSGRIVPHLFERAARNEPLLIDGNGPVLDFVHVDTVVEALIAASKRPVVGQTLNVGSGHGISLEDLARKIITATGSRSRIEYQQNQSPADHFIADIEKGQAALGYSTAGPMDDWDGEACVQTNDLRNLGTVVHKYVGQRVLIGVETLEEQMALVLVKHKSN